MKKNIIYGLFALVFALPVFAFVRDRANDIQVFYPNNNEQNELFNPAELIVRFKDDEKPFRRITVPASLHDVYLKMYKNRSDVLYAEPNYVAHAYWTPNDSYYGLQWHFDNPIGTGVEAEEAWDALGAPGNPGSGVTVAVIDTGVAYEDYRERGKRYYQAPDFANTCFVSGWDFVDNDAHPNDDNAHGTHVAGTIAESTNNANGAAGIAYKACIMPIKVLGKSGSGTYADIANGIRFATDNGAHVINMSLGGPTGASVLEDAIRYASERGVVIVAASGNDGTAQIGYPAAYSNYVIAVGATRYDGARSSYSSYGTGLSLVAPGGDTSVDQNGDGYVDGVLQQTFNPNTKNTADFGYWFFNGTSMASPHVAAVATLLLAKDSTLTGSQIRSALEETAVDLGPAGWDAEYGFGRVNARAALEWVPGSTPPPTPPVNQSPVANAGADKNAYVSAMVLFDGSGSFDPDGSIVSYDWDFGDGATLSTTTTNIAQHAYALVGTYTVTLTVTDNNGATGADTAVAVISEVAPANVLHVGNIVLTGDTRRGGQWCRVFATVPVYSATGSAVSGATVAISWSGAYASMDTATTALDGTASFSTPWKRCATFMLSVDNVTKGGWTYDPGANVETSETIF